MYLKLFLIILGKWENQQNVPINVKCMQRRLSACKD